MSEVYQKKELLAIMNTGVNKRELQESGDRSELTKQCVSTVTHRPHNGPVSAMAPLSVLSVLVYTEVYITAQYKIPSKPNMQASVSISRSSVPSPWTSGMRIN